MTFHEFERLVRNGEKANVDFKIICNAFNRTVKDHEKAKAELVKDICAMANNGAVASYLIIGVGDNKRTIRSVTDPNLTSQNVQTLVRDSIHPRPRVKVSTLTWPRAPKLFAAATFVLIQVGPNGKHAFRFAKDYICPRGTFHFRKNDVWVRNQDTSDLATPEQIFTLLSTKRRPDPEPQEDIENTEYRKLAKAGQLDAVAKDAYQFFSELGQRLLGASNQTGTASVDKTGFWTCLRIRGNEFLFRCIFRQKMSIPGVQGTLLLANWQLEHGLLVFLLGPFFETAKARQLSVDLREPWGDFCTIVPEPRELSYLPNSFAHVPVSFLITRNLRDTRHLRRSLTSMLDAFQGEDVLFGHLNANRKLLTNELRRWARKPGLAAEAEQPGNDGIKTHEFLRRLRPIMQQIDNKPTTK